jgi:hypothetical protein
MRPPLCVRVSSCWVVTALPAARWRFDPAGISAAQGPCPRSTGCLVDLTWIRYSSDNDGRFPYTSRYTSPS